MTTSATQKTETQNSYRFGGSKLDHPTDKAPVLRGDQGFGRPAYASITRAIVQKAAN